MTEETQERQRVCIVVCCGSDGDDKTAKTLSCDSEEAKELLAKLKDLCDLPDDCC